ncbi:MAG: sulfatase-like hydrolase/transferase, partial [Candidatus Glassbacteria bacterium]
MHQQPAQAARLLHPVPEVIGMKRREFFIAGAAAAALPLVTGSGCGAGQARPNVLFICTDQFNAATAGFAGHPLVYTPNLDRLARRGTVFTNCYSNSPVCVPARASLFTGLFAHEVEAYDNAAPFDGRAPCWTNRLAQSGYLCRATGKLDFVAGRDYGLLEVDTGHGHDTNPDITAYFRNPLVPRLDSRAQIEGFIDQKPNGDERCVAETLRFLADDTPGLGGRPWLEYVGLTSPHPPWRVPRRYFDMYPLDNISLPEMPGGRPPALHPCLMAVNHYNRFDAAPIPDGNILRARAAYYGSISRLDEWVGQILAELEKTGRAENTVVVFTSDHGEMLGEHGMWFKSCPYDQAARVPLVIAGPG